MTEEKETEIKSYLPPKGNTTTHQLIIDKQNIFYKAHAEWIILQKNDKPLAEMFHVAYIAEDKNENRPLIFVFNGGPGAASAYLHLGALGPKKVLFNVDGTAPKPPVKLIDNEDSWLSFSDLVFIDPIGTGFSRMLDEEEINKGKDKENKSKVDDKEYFKLNRDLEAMGEFIQRFLSKHGRWESPVYLVGESYGGFRVACLAKRLQQGYGVGLNGVIIISPALEFILLNPSDYDIQAWTDEFPSLALAAMWHGKSKIFKKGSSIVEVLKSAEDFAHNEMIKMLSLGNTMNGNEKAVIMKKMSEYLGISEEVIKKAEGRVPFRQFSRMLLKGENKVIGHYDSSIQGIDPYPDRELFEGPDPTLFGSERIFTSGINAHIRKNLCIETERDYHLLNMEVNKSWKVEETHALLRQVGATDELRYGMALNPHMKVFITHGYHDLVTPYYSSTRLVAQMRLNRELVKNVTIKNYCGGHMFYLWKESRQNFKQDIFHFVEESK
ncbi:MAG: hypothetical protein MRJ65_12240 [Candidatus Brocadiaceae bacterium]|nr:hypothetical protein [Candidatus Brocadiaceae bacterium]